MAGRTALSTRAPLLALVTAEATSTFGTQMSALAIPWFVLITTGSPARMGVVLGVELLPLAVFGIPSGLVLDRFGARTTMLVCDATRAPLIGLIPVLHAVGALSFGVLLILVAAIGLLSTPYFAAQRLVIPQVVGTDGGAVAKGNALVEGATNAANLGGPAVAGVLIAVIGATGVMWIDAATYWVSFALILVAVPMRRRPTDETPPRILDGLRYIKGDRLVARAAASSIVFGVAFRLLFISFPLLAFYRYDENPRIAGWLLAAWGAGAILGSTAAYRLVSRAHPMQVAALAALGTALPLWLLVPDLSIWTTATGVALSSAAIPSINAPYLAMLSTRVPQRLQGQVFQAILTINNIAGPAAYLLGGSLIAAIGLTWSYAIVASGATLAAVNFVLATRTSGFLTMPRIAEG